MYYKNILKRSATKDVITENKNSDKKEMVRRRPNESKKDSSFGFDRLFVVWTDYVGSRCCQWRKHDRGDGKTTRTECGKRRWSEQ